MIDIPWWLQCSGLRIKQRIWPHSRHIWHGMRGDHEVYLCWQPERQAWRLTYRVGNGVHTDSKPKLRYLLEGVEQFIEAEAARDSSPPAHLRQIL